MALVNVIHRRSDEEREPVFETDADRTSFLVCLPLRAAPSEAEAPRAGTMSAPSQHKVEVLRMRQTEKGILELMQQAGRANRTKFRHQVLDPLLEAGFIERTVPAKPRSSLQKYRLTERWRSLLAALPRP